MVTLGSLYCLTRQQLESDYLALARRCADLEEHVAKLLPLRLLCASAGTIRRLEIAKRERGADWVLHSSWCSNDPIFVARVRLNGEGGPGTPRVGTLTDVLAWAAAEAERL